MTLVPPPADEGILVFENAPFVLRSEASRRLLAMVQRVARYPNGVMITGETGSGKELVARALHHYSLRCTRPWIDVNCAALPEHLVESELFGYEKGAFSGADSTKSGFFELAHQGTLFLDEIGDLEPRMQVKLLRVLDGVPYYRLGGSKKVTVDVRVVAATNHNLEQAVRNGSFRSDLFHRLNQIQLHVPPLRERLEDLEGIAEFVLRQVLPAARFSEGAMEALRQYRWPGNIRELKNVVTRVAIAHEEPDLVVQVAHLPPEISGVGGRQVAGPGAETPLGDLDSMERLMIEQALAKCNGDQALAAEQVGISKRTLLRKLKQYRLESAPAANAPLGFLDLGQQRYFRVSVELPVVLRSPDGYELRARSTNVSATGLGLQGVQEPFKLTKTLEVELQLRDGDAAIRGKGKITWADAQGRAGMRFLALEPASQVRLDQWLAAQLREEGWSRML